MVELSCQLKDSALLMNKSVQETEKILNSTERAVEHSLAGTSRVNDLEDMFPMAHGFRSYLHVCHGGSTYTSYLRLLGLARLTNELNDLLIYPSPLRSFILEGRRKGLNWQMSPGASELAIEAGTGN